MPFDGKAGYTRPNELSEKSLGVTGMANIPGLATQPMQEKIDELGTYALKSKLNPLIESMADPVTGVPTVLEVNNKIGEAQFEAGAGDMARIMYDPQGKRSDIFRFVEEAVAAAVATAVEEAEAATLERDHPVGSLYFSTTPDDPSLRFAGTTWQTWGEGRMPVGVTSSDTDFNAAEKTGGAKTHTLTVAQMPNHNHYVTNGVDGNTSMPAYTAVVTSNTGAATSSRNPISMSHTGGGAAHNNMPPYITCYMWVRIA